MKHIFRFFACFVLFASAAQAQNAKTWALLVGVGSYTNPQISSLRFPAKDAISLRDALRDLGGVPGDQVKFLADNTATKANIYDAVKSLSQKVERGDKIIVFLAGHGVTKDVGAKAKSYLLPYDVKGLTTESLKNSAVDLRELADELGKLPASQFVLFVDACREDPTPGRGIKGNTMNDVLSRGLTVFPEDDKAESATLFACSIGQRAYEDATLGHGVFTKWILEGLTKGAVPETNGDVNLLRLYSYVSENVANWAKKTSDNGDFEVEQTPELVTANPLDKPLVFLNVTVKPKTAPSVPATPAKVITVALPRSALIDANDPAAKPYKKAIDAETRQQWEVAEISYKMAIEANPKFAPAHEALGELHRLQGRNSDAIVDALSLVSNVSDAHSLSVLSRAYSRYAESGAGTGNTQTTVKPVGKYKMPRNEKEAMFSAVLAAQEAVKADANSAEAQRAHGYALAALDTKGEKKAKALEAFAKAVALDDADPANHLAYGYGIRYYGAQQKEEAGKNREMERAIATLQEAVKLRPNYYDAHRELAFCHSMLGDTDAALKSIEMANANRGAAGELGEIAALDVTAAGMHQKAAENSTGEKKANHQAASEGYMAEAKEKDPELKTALKILNAVGLGHSIYSLLPDNARKALDPKGTLQAEKNKALNDLKGKADGLFGGFGR